MADSAPGSPPKATPTFPGGPRRRLALHWKILIGLVIGAAAGLTANALCKDADAQTKESLVWWAKDVARPIGNVFLRLIFMLVVPLVFAALTLGIATIGDIRRVGRMGVTTLVLTLVLSSISVAIGVTLVNIVRPGEKIPAEKRLELRERYAGEAAETLERAKKAKRLQDTLLDIIPENPLQEAVGALDGSSKGGGMLAVMFFALLFGIAISIIGEKGRPVVAVLEGVFEACLVLIGFAMRLAPICVVGLVFSFTALLGLDVFVSLLWFIMTVLTGLGIHMIVVYGVLLLLVARRSPLDFFRRGSEAMVTAFATSSSNATLPTALRVTEKRLGVRREVAGFVLTIGATGNQNGTALFEGITVLFLAQLFGIELAFQQQMTVVLMSILAGVGTAGVPGGSLPLIALLLGSVGVPAEGIGLIVGVDRVLDMCRTTVNVAGDMAIAACVDRAEGTQPTAAT